MIDQPPELQLLYQTAPVGLAFLSPDCRYLQINRHLTEICSGWRKVESFRGNGDR